MKNVTLAGLLGALVLWSAPASAEEVRTTRTEEVVVYKSPWCGCCQGWTEQMRASGFEVTVREKEDLTAIKRLSGVPEALQSCHTAFVGGYVVEGHVPAGVIEKLLAERPRVQGLAVPGMPVGSPGMEGAHPGPYDVVKFAKDGTAAVYERVRPQ